MTAHESQSQARALYRTAGVWTDAQLYEALTNIRASCKFTSRYVDELDDLLCNLDGALTYSPEECAGAAA